MSGNTYTIGELAEALGAKVHQVRHAIDRLGVEPVAVKPNVRLFGQSAFRRLEKWMREHSKGVGPGSGPEVEHVSESAQTPAG